MASGLTFFFFDAFLDPLVHFPFAFFRFLSQPPQLTRSFAWAFSFFFQAFFWLFLWMATPSAHQSKLGQNELEPSEDLVSEGAE